MCNWVRLLDYVFPKGNSCSSGAYLLTITIDLQRKHFAWDSVSEDIIRQIYFAKLIFSVGAREIIYFPPCSYLIAKRHKTLNHPFNENDNKQYILMFDNESIIPLFFFLPLSEEVMVHWIIEFLHASRIKFYVIYLRQRNAVYESCQIVKKRVIAGHFKG